MVYEFIEAAFAMSGLLDRGGKVKETCGYMGLFVEVDCRDYLALPSTKFKGEKIV